jgi:hypothetical protein
LPRGVTSRVRVVTMSDIPILTGSLSDLPGGVCIWM